MPSDSSSDSDSSSSSSSSEEERRKKEKKEKDKVRTAATLHTRRSSASHDPAARRAEAEAQGREGVEEVEEVQEGEEGQGQEGEEGQGQEGEALEARQGESKAGRDGHRCAPLPARPPTARPCPRLHSAAGLAGGGWGKYGIIREGDMYTKQEEFLSWLADVKVVVVVVVVLVMVVVVVVLVVAGGVPLLAGRRQGGHPLYSPAILITALLTIALFHMALVTTHFLLRTPRLSQGVVYEHCGQRDLKEHRLL